MSIIIAKLIEPPFDSWASIMGGNFQGANFVGYMTQDNT